MNPNLLLFTGVNRQGAVRGTGRSHLSWIRILLFSCVILATGVNNAQAILRRSDRSEVQYATLAERYPAVCLVCADGKGLASGTLIAPRWVLTAAHVVDPWTLKSEWVKSSVESKWSVLFAGSQEVSVKRFIEYPGYSNKDGGVDIALLELDSPVEGIAPIPCYTGSDELGRQITLVGFGGTGTIETGGPKGAAAMKFLKTPAQQRVKLAGTDVIIEMSDRYFLTRVDRPEQATDLEAGFSGGDSGGPTLIHVDGQEYVAGLMGWTASIPVSADPTLPYGNLLAFHRVSYAAQWIEDTSGVSFGAVRHERTVLLVAGVVLFVTAGWILGRKFLSRRTGSSM